MVEQACAELAKAYPDRVAETEELGLGLREELAEIRGKDGAERVLATKVAELQVRVASLTNAESKVKTPTTKGLSSLESSLKARVRRGEITVMEMKSILETRSLQERLKSKELLLRANYMRPEAPRLGPEERMRKAKLQVAEEQQERRFKEEAAATVRQAKIKELTEQVAQLRRLRAEQKCDLEQSEKESICTRAEEKLEEPTVFSNGRILVVLVGLACMGLACARFARRP